eukprot:5945689-Alexandrium_andersonii.AAC.1
MARAIELYLSGMTELEVLSSRLAHLRGLVKRTASSVWSKSLSTALPTPPETVCAARCTGAEGRTSGSTKVSEKPTRSACGGGVWIVMEE